MNQLKILLLLLAAAVSGCASVTCGTNDILEVISDPIQAQVEVVRLDRGLTKKELKRNVPKEQLKKIQQENKGKKDQDQFRGPLVGVTPAAFSLARKGEYTVTVKKEGYQTAVVEVKNKVAKGGAAGMAGNVLVGGILGAGVDAGTGAMLNLVPNPIDLKLLPTEEPNEEGGQADQ